VLCVVSGSMFYVLCVLVAVFLCMRGGVCGGVFSTIWSGCGYVT